MRVFRGAAFVGLLLCLGPGLLVSCGHGGGSGGTPPAGDGNPLPFTAPVEPLQWKRYSCPAGPREGITLVTGSFNIHGGKEGTPEEIGRALAAFGPFDVFSLQECPEEYARPIAAELGMDFFYADGQSLMSATPLLDPQRFNYALAGRGRFLHATVQVHGREVSVYGVHVDWNETGDLQNRELVDAYLAVDPAERIVLMGDWNEELGSTQARILDERLADAWASLGVCPSCRTTWPSVTFYGAEGQQLIDNTYFNKASGACAVDGEILHLTPNRSDHKPQISRVFFPDEAGFVPPILLDVVYGLGPESVGLLFDKPIARAEVELSARGTRIALSHVEIIGDGSLVRLAAADPLPAGVELTARVLSAVDVDGARIPGPVERSFPLYDNLVENPGADLGETGWTFRGVEPSSGFNHVLPLTGNSHFSGSATALRGRAEQVVALAGFSEVVDAGRGLLVFGGASATGYRIAEGGVSNILLPHDEGEAVVDLLDGEGRLLKHVSGGRLDVMYWQPWRVTDTIPPGTRSARITLRAVAGEMPLTFNSASFDAVHLSVATLGRPHELLGGNLVANPLFEEGREGWEMPAGILLAEDHLIPIRSNINVNTATGDYWIGALLFPAESRTVSQVMSLAAWADRIAQGTLALQWGAYLRTWNPRTTGALRLSFLDGSGYTLQSEEQGPVNIPEWFRYGKTTPVPAGAAAVRFEWIAASEPLLLGGVSFFDAPFVFPVAHGVTFPPL